jgi:TonB family protein
MRVIILFFLIALGQGMFAQTPCQCPSYDSGTTALNELIYSGLLPITDLDSFSLKIKIGYNDGNAYYYNVESNIDLPIFLMLKLEGTESKWQIELDTPDQEGRTYFFINYAFPSEKMNCTKEHYDCVLMSQYTEGDWLEYQDEVDAEDDVFELFDVSEMAKFRNGHKDLVAFLDSSVIWPSTMGMICGNWTVNVIFVVETDGTLSSVETLGSKKGFGLDEEAIRVIKLSSGLWTPAQQGDNIVRMRMRVPVRFRH